jgi:hypothetical protein
MLCEEVPAILSFELAQPLFFMENQCDAPPISVEKSLPSASDLPP